MILLIMLEAQRSTTSITVQLLNYVLHRGTVFLETRHVSERMADVFFGKETKGNVNNQELYDEDLLCLKAPTPAEVVKANKNDASERLGASTRTITMTAAFHVDRFVFSCLTYLFIARSIGPKLFSRCQEVA